MNTFEILIFTIYFSMLLVSLVAIQIYNPGKLVREQMVVENTDEKFIQSEFEEPDSDCDNNKPSFNPETETYTMTENPILRRRHSEEAIAPALDMVD